MTYKVEPKNMGLTITISSHRKHGNGAVGGGRKSTSGKKAVIHQNGGEKVVLTGSTTTELLKKVRNQFNVPHYVAINKKGKTRI